MLFLPTLKRQTDKQSKHEFLYWEFTSVPSGRHRGKLETDPIEHGQRENRALQQPGHS